MPKFSAYFGVNQSQGMLDFVDVDTDVDMPLFIDPYSFTQRHDVWAATCLEDIVSFFEAVLDSIRKKQDNIGRALLNNLNEPNETCLGISKGIPSGRGIGGHQASDLYDKIKSSKAAQTGLLDELSDCELFVEGIGRDKISDMTTNIIRKNLIKYTQEQCNLHNIPLTQGVPSGKLWDSFNRRWTEKYTELPVVKNKKIILVPKASVCWRPDFSHQSYYNNFVLTYLQDYHLSASSSLVEVLRNGRRRVTKKSLKEIHPLSKNFLADFSEQHPEVLTHYKKILGVSRELKDSELDSEFDEKALADSLINTLKHVDMGNDQATKYHSLIVGILEFLFYPHLIYPVKEYEIHNGRKRIDIKYTNNSTEGFFYRRHREAHVHASIVVVECKNYSREIANPELDQIAGRFSPIRGKFGILTCRNFDNKSKFIERCRDTAKEDRGFIIALDDNDIIMFLDFIHKNERLRIDKIMEERFQEIIA